MRRTSLFLLLLLSILSTNHVEARLQVCNQTDLVLMVVVGYDTSEQRIATEGWWRVYPGTCEVPVDVAFLEGDYFLHAESNPRSTMPGDAFSWGEEKSLCVKLADFRIPNANKCIGNGVTISFNRLNKNWRNLNKVDIVYDKRTYLNQFRAQVAGIQRMLSIIGYDIGDIDGVIGEKTAIALNEIAARNNVFGFDFASMFPILEKIIAEQQRLDN